MMALSRYLLILVTVHSSLQMDQSLDQLISTVRALPDLNQRKIASVLGAVVADAASVPLEWIYDEAKLVEVVGEREEVAFWPKCESPYFDLPTGSVSCYSDEMLTTLGSMATSQQVSIDQITRAVEETFGSPSSPYQVSLARRGEGYPVEGPWLNGVIIQSVKNIKSGKQPSGDSKKKDQDGFFVSLPAFLSTLDYGLTRNVTKIVSVNDIALKYSRVQQSLVENFLTQREDPIKSTLASVDDEDIASVLEMVYAGVGAGKTVNELVATFGKSCAYPGSLQSELAVLLLTEDYQTAVRTNIMAGGDSCSRAGFIGAVLGAQGGIDVIPRQWMEKVFNVENILEDLITVFGE